MQTITIPLPAPLVAGLKYLGAEDEKAQADLARRLIADYFDDVALGMEATAAAKEGYAGTQEGEKWLQSMKNAED